jgi:hypothetical protein
MLRLIMTEDTLEFRWLGLYRVASIRLDDVFEVRPARWADIIRARLLISRLSGPYVFLRTETGLLSGVIVTPSDPSELYTRLSSRPSLRLP